MALVCSITKENITKPVVVIQTGHTYEGNPENLRYLSTQKKCACCGQNFERNLVVVPDQALFRLLPIINDIAGQQACTDLEAIHYEKASEEQQRQLANRLVCPFTGAIMRIPVLLKNGLDTQEHHADAVAEVFMGVTVEEEYAKHANLDYVLNHTLNNLIKDFLKACPEYQQYLYIERKEQAEIQQAFKKKEPYAIQSFYQKYQYNPMFQEIIKEYPVASYRHFLFTQQDKALLLNALQYSDIHYILDRVNQHICRFDVLFLPIDQQSCALQIAYQYYIEQGSPLIRDLLTIAQQSTDCKHLDICQRYEYKIKSFSHLSPKYQGICLPNMDIAIPSYNGVFVWKYRSTKHYLTQHFNEQQNYMITSYRSKLLWHTSYLHFMTERIKTGIAFENENFIHFMQPIKDLNDVLIIYAKGDVRCWNFKKNTFVDKSFPDTQGHPLLSAVALIPEKMQLIYGCIDGRIYIWNFNNSELDAKQAFYLTLPITRAITALHVTEHGQILVGSQEGTLRILAQADFSLQQTIELGEMITAIYQPKHPALKYCFLIGLAQGDIMVFDINTGQPIKTLQRQNDNKPDPLRYYPNNKKIDDFGEFADGTVFTVDKSGYNDVIYTWDITNGYCLDQQVILRNTIVTSYYPCNNELFYMNRVEKTASENAVTEHDDPFGDQKFFLEKQASKTITCAKKEGNTECLIQ